MPTPDAAACLFCRIRDGEIPARILFRDEHVLAFADVNPQAPFHALVIPLRHVQSLGHVEAGDAELVGRLALVGARLAREAGHGDGGFRAVMNAGPDAGQTVHHLHLHVLAGRPLGWPPG